jgi:RND family efflux transporter MFP subunit
MKSIFIKTFATIALAGGLFVLVESCTESQGKGSPIPKTADPIPVKVTNIRKSNASLSIVSSGRLTTDDETLLSFKTGGVISAVFVKEGDRVTKGQILATLDPTEINALVAQAKSGLEKAERDLFRARNLYQDSVATLEQLQNAETAFDVATQQYSAASFNKSYSLIKAPGSGYVLKKFVNAGQVVGIGDPILRTNGAGTSHWILRTGVSDKQWSLINIGDGAEVVIDAFPGKKFTGKVIRKSETADPSNGAFTVEVEVANQGLKLAAGMFASATITGSDKTSSWNVPYEAVLDANGNEGFVFVTADNKIALKKAVTIESFDGTSIRINSGLNGTESLIISGSAYLTDQSPIRIIK